MYAVQTPDLQRLFVLNRGDDTLTVINTRNDTPDACTPFQNQNGQWITCHPTIQLPTGSGPIYAEYNSATQQLVVANYDGGSISVVSVPLDQFGNDANTYTNSNCTTYAACGAVTGGFGTVTTVKVGNTATPNPASVTVLADGSKAYTANQNDDGGTGNGTVTVVNLHTYTVEKTLTVVGHPRTVVNTQNSEYSKIYVASPDSPFITIIESSPTVTDLIDTTVLLEGTPVDIRTTTQTGSSGNNNYTSRVPGYGQPCNLPGSASTGLACRMPGHSLVRTVKRAPQTIQRVIPHVGMALWRICGADSLWRSCRERWKSAPGKTRPGAARPSAARRGAGGARPRREPRARPFADPCRASSGARAKDRQARQLRSRRIRPSGFLAETILM